VAISEAVLRKVRLDVDGADHRIEIGPNARLSNVTVEMRGRGHTLLIQSHVQIHSGEFRFWDDGCSVTIGERTTIFGAAFGVTEGGAISIGGDCLISSDVDIRNGDSHSIIDHTSGARLNGAQDVEIGDHVWLGARVMVLKGSRIGHDTVIGAGSITSGDIPSHCVAGGVPARAISEGTSWRRERI
jgi:acetyltransferase-like isoleucine patch superfamily enzyme